MNISIQGETTKDSLQCPITCHIISGNKLPLYPVGLVEV